MSGAPHRPFWRRRLLVPALVLLGANVLLAAAYTVPRGLKQRDISERARVLRQEVELARESVLELERRAELVRENEAAEKRFFAELVSTRKASLVPILTDLERLVAEPGLKAGGRTFTANQVREMPLLRLEMSVTLTAGYRQLVEFLGGLERSRHFVTVDRIQLREKRAEDEAGEGSLAVNVSAWFRSDGETLGAR
ncbi:MAG TPA: GspMb/PilO family protein [Vicinamibacteria bacterium]